MSRSNKQNDRASRRRNRIASEVKEAAREKRRVVERQETHALIGGASDPDAVILPTRNRDVADPWNFD